MKRLKIHLLKYNKHSDNVIRTEHNHDIHIMSYIEQEYKNIKILLIFIFNYLY